jgi:hypothetical protein
MSNSSSLLKTVIAWIIVAAVVVIGFKILIAIVAGLVQTLFAVVLLVGFVFLVVWALRHL